MLEKKVYKNWREICYTMNWKTSGGTYKMARLKELESLCKFHKEKNSYVIEEIYSAQKFISKKNSADYIRLIQLFIMDKLASTDSETSACKISLSKKRLLRELNMVNHNYNECMKHPYKFSKSENLEIETVMEYKNSTEKMLSNNLEKALKNLEKSKLITWYKGYNVVLGRIDNLEWYTCSDEDFEKNIKYKSNLEVETSEIHVELTDEEVDLMRDCERTTLVNMGFYGVGNDNLNVVYRANKLKEFYLETTKLFKERSLKRNIIYYYPTYVVKFNKELITNGKDIMKDYIIDKFAREEQIIELNDCIKNRIIENAKKRKNNNSNGKYAYRKNDNYLENISKINSITIDECAEYVVNKVLQTNISDFIEERNLIEELLNL